MSKSYKWYKIADSINDLPFANNGLTTVTVNGKTVCLGNTNETLFACASKCPHAGGIMANGYIDAVGNIVCPLHRYKFDKNTGRNSSGEGYFLKTFPVEHRPNGVFIGFESNSMFDWIK